MAADSQSVALPPGFEVEEDKPQQAAIPPGFEIEAGPSTLQKAAGRALDLGGDYAKVFSKGRENVGEFFKGVLNSGASAGAAESGFPQAHPEMMPGFQKQTEQGVKQAAGAGPLLPLTEATPKPGIARGVASVAEGLTTPANVGIIAGTGAAGSLATGATPEIKAAYHVAETMLSAYFSQDMIRHSTIPALQQAREAFQKGDLAGLQQAATEAGLTGILGILAGVHAGSTGKKTVKDAISDFQYVKARAAAEKAYSQRHAWEMQQEKRARALMKALPPAPEPQAEAPKPEPKPKAAKQPVKKVRERPLPKETQAPLPPGFEVEAPKEEKPSEPSAESSSGPGRSDAPETKGREKEAQAAVAATKKVEEKPEEQVPEKQEAQAEPKPEPIPEKAVEPKQEEPKPDAAKAEEPVEEQAPISARIGPRIAGFETAKGSKYTTEGEGTRRFKSATGEAFDASDRTAFISPETNKRILETLREYRMTPNIRASIRDVGGKLGILVKDRDTGEVRNDLSRAFEYSGTPQVGLHPVEVWNKNPKTGEYGYHLGHAITRVEEPVEEKPVPAPAVEPEAPSKEAEPPSKAIEPEVLPPEPEEEFKRTTPKLGTPEREKLDAEFTGTDKVNTDLYTKRAELEKKLNDTKRYTKSYDALEKRVQSARDAEGLSSRRHAFYRATHYDALREDAASQNDNVLLREAARYSLKPKDYKGTQAKLEQELRKLLPEAGAGDNENAKHLTPEENESAVKEAVKQSAESLLAHPLLAGDDMAKRLRGSIHGRQTDVLRDKYLKEFETLKERGKEEAGIIHSGEYDRQRRRIENAYEPDEIQKAIKDLGGYVDKGVKERASANEAKKEKSLEFSRSLRPMSEYPAVSVRTKEAWRGNVAKEGTGFLTDGHAMLKEPAVDKKRLSSVQSAHATYDRVKVKRVVLEKTFNDAANGATKPLEEVGHGKAEGFRPVVYYTDPDGKAYSLDPRKVKLIMSLTKADEIRGANPKNAVAFYKGGEPVAIVMPLESEEINVEEGRKAARQPKQGETPPSPEEEAPAAKSAEAGTISPELLGIPQLMHMLGHDPDAPKANYSGMGAMGDLFFDNLSQLKRASPKAMGPTVRAAASKSEASVIMRSAMPHIHKALDGIKKEDFFRYLIQGRLQGIRGRWSDLAETISAMNDDQLQNAVGTGGMLGLLEHLEDKAGFSRNLAETAAALAAQHDAVTLRHFMAGKFLQAAASVHDVMPRDEVKTMQGDSRAQKALQVYRDLIEKPLNESHAQNEGIFSDALGPLNTYYPLVPLDEPQRARARVGANYRKPRNISNHFATGLAENYDTSIDTLRTRLESAVKTNNKAAMLQTLEDEGLLARLLPGEAGNEIEMNGQRYHATRVQLSEDRSIIKDGKSIFVPGRQGLVPDWLYNELKPIIEKGHFDQSTVSKVISALNTFAISGPADVVFHSANLMGALVSNTPFLGTGFGSRIGSFPVAKRFTAMVKLLASDPMSEGAAPKLQRLAKAGALPEKFGSVTFSKEYAEQTGAKLKRLSFAPALYGPSGVDVRARLLMHDIATSIDPNISDDTLRAFVNQLGNYTPALQGSVLRSLKKAGLAPFATAGSTMARNGVNAWTGMGPMPKAGISLRLWQQLTGGGLVAAGIYIAIHKELYGNWPWENPLSRFMQLQVTGEWRKHPLAQALFGPGEKPGYVNMNWFNPLAGRGARLLGVTGAYDTLRSGGTVGQAVETGEKDAINSLLHPVLGPVPRAVFVGATGVEPYLTGLRDDQGKMEPRFYPKVKDISAGGSHLKRAFGALEEMNAFWGNVGSATGMGDDAAKEEGNRWARMVFDLATPGLVGRAYSNEAKTKALQRQRMTPERQSIMRGSLKESEKILSRTGNLGAARDAYGKHGLEEAVSAFEQTPEADQVKLKPALLDRIVDEWPSLSAEQQEKLRPRILRLVQ